MLPMARIDHYEPGSFCWGELATTDPESAKTFYSEMFGWTPNDSPTPNGVYTLFRSDGNEAGAMFKAPPGVSTNWTLYFAVASAEDSAAKVAPLGGKLINGPFDVMGMGSMAVVQDPQGAVFCLWEAKSTIGATHGGPLNQLVWPELHTPDPAAAVAFYSGLFGWQTKPESGSETAQYIEIVNRGRSMAGIMPMRGDEWKGVPPHWMPYVTVADCDAQAAKARELGAVVCVPPTDIPMTGRFAVITDAQGATFSIIRMAHHSPNAAQSPSGD